LLLVEDRRFSMIDSLNTSVNLHGEVSTKPGQLQFTEDSSVATRPQNDILSW